MKREGYEPVLKKTRWLLLKRKGNLKQPEKGRLRDLLNYNLRTVRAYLLKEDFQQFWSTHHRHGQGSSLISGVSRRYIPGSNR